MPDEPPARRLRSVARGQGDDAPEALLAAALIDSGTFDPSSYRVTVDDLGCWEKVWDYCLDYQRTAGAAPPWELVAKAFPDFQPMRGVDPTWAAKQLKSAAASRMLRGGITTALNALNEADDVESAYAALSSIRQPDIVPGSVMVSAWDDVMTSAYKDVVRIPTPYQRLNELTGRGDESRGGIGAGELWYFMARPEQGKSMMATLQAVTAVRLGYRVGYISLEMPYRQVIRRFLRIAAGPDAKTRALVMSENPDDVAQAQKVLHRRMDGAFWCVDTNTNGGMVSVNQVASFLPEVDLLIVDHVGLLTNPEGRSNTEELRVVGGVSNILRQHVIASDTAVLALSHVNRLGDNDKTMAPPKLVHAAESDHIGRDADVAISMKRISEKVMVAQTVKQREGRAARWWHRYDVEGADFTSLSHEQAIDESTTQNNERNTEFGLE